jgi:hypothetical protein
MPPLVLLLAVMAYRSTGGCGMFRPAPRCPALFPQKAQVGRVVVAGVANAQKPTRCTERPSLAFIGLKKRFYYFFPRLPDCYFSTASQIRSSAGFGTGTAHHPASALKFPPTDPPNRPLPVWSSAGPGTDASHPPGFHPTGQIHRPAKLTISRPLGLHLWARMGSGLERLYGAI